MFDAATGNLTDTPKKKKKPSSADGKYPTPV